MILIGSPDEIRALVTPSLETQPILLRAQESGLCVHYDPNVSAPEDGDGPDYRKDPPLCAYPYLCKDGCPHLDNPEILCPVKDACAAMHEVARMRDECEAEQEEQDADMEAATVQQGAISPESAAVWSEIKSRYPLPAPSEDPGRLHTYAVEPDTEFPDPAPEEEPVYETRRGAPLANMWAPAECAAIASAGTRQEALAGYRAAFPDSDRTDGAVMRQWYAVRAVPVTATDGRRGTWTPEEETILLKAKTLAAAVKTYREKFGDKRTYAALSSRFYRVRKNQVEPTPDFAGDTLPVTQHEGSKGFYGDARALHTDMIDGMVCDKPIDACEPIVRGDRVALVDDPGLVGTAVIVNVRSKFASVEFPDDDGPARVYPLSALRRVVG